LVPKLYQTKKPLRKKYRQSCPEPSSGLGLRN
jgi:hypothetical protein